MSLRLEFVFSTCGGGVGTQGTMASPIREGASFKVDGGKYAGESGVVIGATVRISPHLDPWSRSVSLFCLLEGNEKQPSERKILVVSPPMADHNIIASIVWNALLQPRRVKVNLGRHGIKYLQPDSIRVLPVLEFADREESPTATSATATTSIPKPSTAATEVGASDKSRLPSALPIADRSGVIFFLAVAVLSVAPMTGIVPGFPRWAAAQSQSVPSSHC